MEHVITLAIVITWSIGTVAIAIYGVYEFITGYYNSKKSLWWQRAADGARSSLTILWMRFVFIVGVGIDQLANLADFLNAPAVSGAMREFLDPKIVGIILIAVAFIGELARRRTLSKRHDNA